MKYLYTGLFSLSIILINPWGMSRGEIWTQPKVLALLLIVLLNLSILWQEREALTLSKSWKINKLLWEVFLGIGLLSTLLSPFPLRSLFGQNEMGDGWLYWLIIALFTLSNSLILTLRPELARSQLNGLLIGGMILTISIFPQVFNWHVDYTATTGQLLQENILASTIFQNQQPIGLYSHRGHASFVLAAVAILAIFAWQRRWINTRYFIIALGLMIGALLVTQTRGGILAFVVATAYLLGRKYYKSDSLFYPTTRALGYTNKAREGGLSKKGVVNRDLVSISAALACMLVIALTTTTRQIAGLPVIKQITSDRIYLWQLSMQGISQRPIFGWGFDGFGIAYPYIVNSTRKQKVVHLGNFSFDYLGKDGQVRTKALISNKAHNLILDAVLSVGILGMACYCVLFGLCLWQIMGSRYSGIEAVALTYLIFTLTWFEGAQFAHIAWWVLSFGSNQDKTYNTLELFKANQLGIRR